MNDKKIFTSYFISLGLSAILLVSSIATVAKANIPEYRPIKTTQEQVIEEYVTDVPETTTEESVTVECESTTVEHKPQQQKTEIDEIELLALVTVAEAEGESEYGKRLVIDTILNRVDDSRFPNTIYGVVYQKNQFTSMWNGRVNRCVVTDDVRQLVREELERRTNSDVIFFQMYNYSPYGTPMFKEGCHYFSSY